MKVYRSTVKFEYNTEPVAGQQTTQVYASTSSSDVFEWRYQHNRKVREENAANMLYPTAGRTQTLIGVTFEDEVITIEKG